MDTADLARLLEIHGIAARHNLAPDTRGAHYSEDDNTPATVAITFAVRNPTAVAARLAARDAGWAAFVRGGTEAMHTRFYDVLALVEPRFRERAEDALRTMWAGIGDGEDQLQVTAPGPVTPRPVPSAAPFRIGEARPATSILPEPVS